MMTTQAWLTKTGGPYEIREAPVNPPGANEVIIRLKAVALQPIEAVQFHHGPIFGQSFPYLDGFEGSGVVEGVGPAVTQFKTGDEVLAALAPDLPNSTGYQTVTTVPEIRMAKKSSKLSWEEAASLPVGWATAALGLTNSGLGVGLPWLPRTPSNFIPRSILVLGGSSSVGATAIQLLRRLLPTSKILTTCSPKNHALVTRLGADKAFDQASPTAVADIKADAGGHGVDAIFDSVSGSAKMPEIWAVFDPSGPKKYADVVTPDSRKISAPGDVHRKTFSFTGESDFGKWQGLA